MNKDNYQCRSSLFGGGVCIRTANLWLVILLGVTLGIKDIETDPKPDWPDHIHAAAWK